MNYLSQCLSAVLLLSVFMYTVFWDVIYVLYKMKETLNSYSTNLASK